MQGLCHLRTRPWIQSAHRAAGGSASSCMGWTPLATTATEQPSVTSVEHWPAGFPPEIRGMRSPVAPVAEVMPNTTVNLTGQKVTCFLKLQPYNDNRSLDTFLTKFLEDGCVPEGLGEHFSSPSGSRSLVNFRLKISPLVATIFRSFSGNETSKWDYHLPVYVMSPKIFENVQKNWGSRMYGLLPTRQLEVTGRERAKSNGRERILSTAGYQLTRHTVMSSSSHLVTSQHCTLKLRIGAQIQWACRY